MKHHLLVTLVLLWSLAACQPANLQPPVKTSPTLFPVVTDTPSRSSSTATALVVTSARPTSTPAPIATSLPVASLAEKGLLLLWDDHARQYSLLDLNTGAAPYTVRWNPECEWNLLPHTTTAVCERGSGQQYLSDVLRKSEHELPIWDSQLIDWSPNGRLLVYTRGTDGTQDIFSYDLTTNVTQTLATDIDWQKLGSWLTQPILSADGQSLIAVGKPPDHKSYNVFEVMKQGPELRRIGLNDLPATWDIAWSPVARQFVYGATDIEQEIGPSPNYLFVVNMQTDEIRELAKSPESLFFWSRSLEWSPTGKQIAVGLWDLAFNSEPQACVIDVDTARQACLPALRSLSGRFLTWSPSGEYIVVVNTERNLVISNPDGSEAVKLLENVPEDFLLFWR